MTASRYVIVEDRSGDTGYSPRGAALDLWRYRGTEVILAGPAETGKTRACLEKLDGLLWKYAGAQAVMIRKVRDTIFGTVLQTYLKKVLREDSPVQPYGGERPQWFDYPNGSRLWLAGIDDPGKALSSERDFVYVNQCEELHLADWETLTTRTTGRAGNAPYGQCMADCNPGGPTHWIKKRVSLKLLESRHEDNPTLWDGKNWTEQGKRTLASLDALTGVRKERLRFGRWVSAEGVVYEFDARRHVIDAMPPGWQAWPKIRVFDFGYNNPFACLWFALDPDGRLYLYREWYMSRRTVREHAVRVKGLSGDERYEANVADHDAEDRATLAEAGIWTLPATKAITPGIQAVEDRLKVAPDGKPRLFVLRGALVERDEQLFSERKPCCTLEEFDSYSWPKAADGRAIKEIPVDKDNHGMDCIRYACAWAKTRGGFDPSKIRSGGRAERPPAGTFGSGDARRQPKF